MYLVNRASGRYVVAAAVLLMLGGVTGCGSDRHLFKKSSETSGLKLYDDIAWVSIMASTPLLDFDHDGYPDGVSMRVYLYRSNETKRPVGGKGGMRFRLVRREVGASSQPTEQQVKLWELTQDDVVRSLARDQFGFTCHVVELYWQDVKPCGGNVYIRGEFVGQDQEAVKSKLLSVPVPLRPPGRTMRTDTMR